MGNPFFLLSSTNNFCRLFFVFINFVLYHLHAAIYSCYSLQVEFLVYFFNFSHYILIVHWEHTFAQLLALLTDICLSYCLSLQSKFYDRQPFGTSVHSVTYKFYGLTFEILPLSTSLYTSLNLFTKETGIFH